MIDDSNFTHNLRGRSATFTYTTAHKWTLSGNVTKFIIPLIIIFATVDGRLFTFYTMHTRDN